MKKEILFLGLSLCSSSMLYVQEATSPAAEKQQQIKIKTVPRDVALKQVIAKEIGRINVMAEKLAAQKKASQQQLWDRIKNFFMGTSDK